MPIPELFFNLNKVVDWRPATVLKRDFITVVFM